MKLKLLVVLALIIIIAIGFAWWWNRDNSNGQELALHGNIDLRQTQLAFNNSERIAAVLVQEGDRVKKGQVVARLDTSRLEPQVAQAEATAAHNSRPLTGCLMAAVPKRSPRHGPMSSRRELT